MFLGEGHASGLFTASYHGKDVVVLEVIFFSFTETNGCTSMLTGKFTFCQCYLNAISHLKVFHYNHIYRFLSAILKKLTNCVLENYQKNTSFCIKSVLNQNLF